MMTDRELLELAAKAAGYDVEWKNAFTPFNYTGFVIYEGATAHDGKVDLFRHWNPLTDDGDALRLAVKLGIHIRVWIPQQIVNVDWYTSTSVKFIDIPFGDDEMLATRRAIVSTAAEIGKGVK